MIAIMGSGAFGTALAVALAADGTPVFLWGRDPEQTRDMQIRRNNARHLPNVRLPDSVVASSELDTIPAKTPVLLSIPTQQLRAAVNQSKHALHDHPLIACCKGIELETGKSPTTVLADILPKSTRAILTGPSFATDIANGLPTALTLACEDKDAGRALQQALTRPNLRIYGTRDTTGAALGGALKNVMAIAAGAVLGAGLGESARAALMTRGYAEMKRMAIELGAHPDTLAGLSGFGDLVLTCTSDKSRNMRFGLALGRSEAFDQKATVEGIATARAVHSRAGQLGIEMPITAAVVAMLDGALKLPEVMEMLLSRPLKEE
ncbi:NAD(P)H-dependent glycerol-3-phosphate dehydrogenase [Sediminimonas qiaohouensis]|uniref:NAD(P)H-dependent glycerol-3-phosphate dehydrogenase n=1 Tax=Sediminimonas qiaohouensis TaxID=552061 RepID=UPI00041AE0B1|nr:NAD(P)H-dependent glycerol-3-phosphate dehydrogenase [Sediminimonas qiaohouensis]